MERLLLRLDAAAKILNVCRSTIYSMISKNEIPAVRIRNALRIPSDALDAWIESRVVRCSEEVMSAEAPENSDESRERKESQTDLSLSG